MKTLTAILINAITRTVESINLPKGNYRALYPALSTGCQHPVNTFECPVELAKGDTLYVDEEGRLRAQDGVGDGRTPGFSFAGRAFAGNGLILGTTPMGESKSATMTVEAVRQAVQFGRIRTLD